jgi:hypothetical protein
MSWWLGRRITNSRIEYLSMVYQYEHPLLVSISLRRHEEVIARHCTVLLGHIENHPDPLLSSCNTPQGFYRWLHIQPQPTGLPIFHA